MHGRKIVAAGLVVLATLLLGAGLAKAKKPVKPPPDPVDTGVICYGWGTVYSVLPDGTPGTTVVEALPNWSPPSHYTHDGMRWFLTLGEISGETAPDGQTRVEVFAVPEEGDPIQVTDAANIQPRAIGLDQGKVCFCWAVDDTRISYVGREWSGPDGEEVVVDGGIYYVDLPCDISELTTPLTPSCLSVPMTYNSRLPSTVTPQVMMCEDGVAWAPDGAAVVYATVEGAFLTVDLDTGAEVPLPADEEGRVVCVRWSPDGSRIMYEQGAEIFSVDVDGTDRQLIVSCDRKGCPEQPCYSPSGTHICFRKRISHPDPKKVRAELRIATVTGADTTTALESVGMSPHWVSE